MRITSSLVSGLALAACAVAVPVTTPSPEESIGGIAIGEILNLLGVGLVTNISTFITLDTLVDNLVSVDFTVKNPLPFELTIDSISTDAGVNNTVYASFSHTFPSDQKLVVPALGTASSGVFGNVILVQGAIASLDIIPLGYLDILNADANLRLLTINGELGIPLEVDGLKQSDVPATYSLDLTGS
ncbi:unnamed protein product [Peniophora sp. CBMAI 1063]|nr:unnamed protein product [Peniophora sp. CBMAI 1063]